MTRWAAVASIFSLMRFVDVVLVFLLAVFFLGVGLVAGGSAILEGHSGTGLAMLGASSGGFLAVAAAGLAWAQDSKSE